MLSFRIPAVLLLPLLLWSCADTPVATTDTSAILPIMPLTPGTQWTNRQIRYDSTGATLSIDTTTGGIVSDTVISGERFGVNPVGMLLINRKDGLWLDDGGSDKYHLLLYPGKVGDTMSLGTHRGVDQQDAGKEYRFTQYIVSTDTLVTVPAGSFHCYHYRLRTRAVSGANGPTVPEWNQDEFHAPGKGEILVESLMGRADGSTFVEYRSELLSYVVK